MFDPNANQFNLNEAEEMLGIDEETRARIQTVISIDLLLAHAGITKDQVAKAYAERVKNDLKDLVQDINGVIGDE